jgi:type IV secretory pathway VirB2 component (pilin)
MDVFVRDIGSAITNAVEGAFAAVGAALRGAVNEVLTVVPAPLAAVVAVAIVLAVGWRLAK